MSNYIMCHGTNKKWHQVVSRDIRDLFYVTKIKFLRTSNFAPLILDSGFSNCRTNWTLCLGKQIRILWPRHNKYENQIKHWNVRFLCVGTSRLYQVPPQIKNELVHKEWFNFHPGVFLLLFYLNEKVRCKIVMQRGQKKSKVFYGQHSVSLIGNYKRNHTFVDSFHRYQMVH